MFLKMLSTILFVSASAFSQSGITDFTIYNPEGGSNPTTIIAVGDYAQYENSAYFYNLNQGIYSENLLVKGLSIKFYQMNSGDYAYNVYSKTGTILSTHKISTNTFLSIISMAQVSLDDYLSINPKKSSPKEGDNFKGKLTCYVDFTIDRTDYKIKSVSPICDSLK